MPEQAAGITRRSFLRGSSAVFGLSLLSTTACERHRYIRPAAELELGSIDELLYSIVHIRSKAILLFRDADGWSALSTRCTYRGCDLTHQEIEFRVEGLLCPCCRTRYTLRGIPHKGWPATHPLPWVDLSFKDGHLYANPGKQHPPSWRYSTPEIEEAIRTLRKRVREEKLKDEVTIPGLLTGKGDGEVGVMFLEDDPNLIHELKMIK